MADTEPENDWPDDKKHASQELNLSVNNRNPSFLDVCRTPHLTDLSFDRWVIQSVSEEVDTSQLKEWKHDDVSQWPELWQYRSPISSELTEVHGGHEDLELDGHLNVANMDGVNLSVPHRLGFHLFPHGVQSRLDSAFALTQNKHKDKESDEKNQKKDVSHHVLIEVL